MRMPLQNRQNENIIVKLTVKKNAIIKQTENKNVIIHQTENENAIVKLTDVSSRSRTLRRGRRLRVEQETNGSLSVGVRMKFLSRQEWDKPRPRRWERSQTGLVTPVQAKKKVKRQVQKVKLDSVYTVEPRFHNNAVKGTPPLKSKMFKSQNYSGFCNVKIPLLNSPCFNSDSPF